MNEKFKKSKWMLATIIYLLIFLSICYSFIIWFAYQTIKELKLQEPVLTDQILLLQNQFSKTLLVQVSE